jgi:ABC-type transport system substrate-binding protein
MKNETSAGYWGRQISRRRLMRGIAGAGAATGIVTLAGCAAPAPSQPTVAPAALPAPPAAPAAGAGSTPAATAAPTARPPKRGGVFRLGGNAETADLDPHNNVTAYLHVWGAAIAYAKLIKFKEDGSTKPLENVPTGDLAESWTQPDETTYVFKMRPGVKWQNIAPVNGRLVVAQDVKLSFERQLALKTLAARLAGVDKIEAADNSTLRITLAKPDADFLLSLAHYHNKIVPHESWELKGDLRDGPVIGSGPWIFEKWERNQTATLNKNPDYYLTGYPLVDRVEFPRIIDAATRHAAFRTQQVDTLPGSGFTPKDVDTLMKASPDIVLDEVKGTNADVLALNMQKPPFDDLRVRQAIQKAIDREALIKLVLNGKGWAYPGLYMASQDYYLPEAEVKSLFQRDLAGAKQLLQQANFAPGQQFELQVSTARDSCVDAAQVVKQQLEEIGVIVNLKPVDTATSTRTVFVEHVHQMFLGPTSPAVSTNGDLLVSFHSTGTQNRANANDKKLDQLIEQQAVMVKDPEARKKALQELQRYQISTATQITLYGLLDQRLRWKYLQGYHFGGLTEELTTYVWLDK